MADSKQDKLGDAHDAAVLASQESAAEDGNILAKGSEANDGGFVQVEGDGWTDEQIAEKEAAAKLEAAEAKEFAKVNAEEIERLGLPEPREQTKEEKKAEELTAAADAAVEAAQADPSLLLKTDNPHDDASIPVLKHPDGQTERPADPPADLANQTGSLTNFGITPIEGDSSDAEKPEKKPARKKASTAKAKKPAAKKPAPEPEPTPAPAPPGPAMTTGVQTASN